MTVSKETGIDPRVWSCVGGSRGAVTWQLGHERLLGIRKRRARFDAEEALWLVVCQELGAHRELGMGSFVEYVSAVLGLDSHSALERIRVARALVRLPATFEKLHASELCWSAVRELSRVVTPETEQEWLGACAKLGVRDIQWLVSGRRPGDLPSTPADESARLHAVRYEVSGSTLALVRQAQDEHRRRTGQSLDEDVFVADLARAYLVGREGSGAASAQVMMTVCPSCRQGTVDAGGQVLALPPSEVERLACDARVVPRGRVEAVVEGTRSAEPGGRSHGGPERPSHGGSGEASHAGPERAGFHVGSEESSSAGTEGASHVGPEESSQGGPADRGSHVGSHDAVARAGVPSPVRMAELERRSGLRVETELSRKVRQLVVRRHHGRCAAPGCSSSMCLHVHHVEPRADGGTHDPELLVPLCDAHHRAVHDGKVRIEGTWSVGFTFRYADGTPYGTAALPDPRSVAAAKGAFSVLRSLGLRHREAEAAVDMIRERIEPDMPMEEVVRLALEATMKLPGMQRVSRVRESEARYVASWAL